MKRERQTSPGSGKSEGEISDIFKSKNNKQQLTLLSGCFARNLIDQTCPNTSDVLLQKALHYFMRIKDNGLYQKEMLNNWTMVGEDAVMVDKPETEDQVSVLIDFFVLCQLATKIFGIDADVFNCHACCKQLYRFASPRDIAKKEFYLFQYGLHCNFD